MTHSSNDAPPRRGCGRPTLWAVAAVLIGMPLSCAILLPIFWNAKLTGSTTNCKSNLKQLGTALLMYCQDYDGHFPPAAYVEGTQSVTVPSLLHPYLKNYQVWECPTDRKNGVKDHTYDETPSDTSVSYGYNGHGLAPNGKGLTEEQLKQPKNTVAFAESTSHLVVPPGLAPALGGTAPAYRHRAGEDQLRINVSWVDGHAKTEATGKLEEIANEEAGKRLGPGIDSFRYWNRW